MNSWIKLDQSFNKLEKRNDRNKRMRRDITTANIEDDSSQENTDLNFSSSSAKKRKLQPLENCTIENPVDSSDECSDVDYNPDGGQLPNTEKRKIKQTLPFVSSTALTNPPSASHSTSTNNSHSWKSWMAIPKLKENVSCQIEESLTDDSDPATPPGSSSSTPDTIIDESSTDSSQIAQQQETMIETQESITPPVAPFIATTTNPPKKRKVRMVKGGMAERLKKSLSQAKSNLLYWHHHRSAELISPGTIVTVDRVENTYGRILIHTKVNDEDTIFSLCSRSVEVHEGDTIEVQFDLDRSHKTDTHVLYSYVDKVLPINEKTA